LDMMLNHGARKNQLTARVFGGACRMKSEPNSDLYVGDRNVDVTMRVLRKLGIPIVGSDTGGKLGRKLHFDQFTGKIRLNYIQNYSFRSEAVQITRGERRNELW